MALTWCKAAIYSSKVASCNYFPQWFSELVCMDEQFSNFLRHVGGPFAVAVVFFQAIGMCEIR